jgi:hypothetical protein
MGFRFELLRQPEPLSVPFGKDVFAVEDQYQRRLAGLIFFHISLWSWLMKLLTLCVVAALLLLMMAPPSVPANAQATGASGKAGQDSAKAARTGSTSKKQ